MAKMKLNVLKNPRAVEAATSGIVVDEPAVDGDPRAIYAR